jgi:hypothetical protein
MSLIIDRRACIMMLALSKWQRSNRIGAACCAPLHLFEKLASTVIILSPNDGTPTVLFAGLR